MRKRWVVVLATVAAAHFAATAASHLLLSSQCSGPVRPECVFYGVTAQVLSLPLLPIVLEFSSGTIGWRRAFAVFAGNSLIVSSVLTCAIGLLARSFAGGRGERSG